MSVDAAEPKTRAKAPRQSKASPADGAAIEAAVADLAPLLNALTSLCSGDFGVRLEPREGVLGQVVERVNQLAALNERRTRELVRASRVICREGRMTERLDEVGSDGDWSTGAAAVNSLIDDLVRPTTEVARVIAAVAEGDLSQQIAGQPVKGEFLRIGTTVNTMVDQLSSFADEVTINTMVDQLSIAEVSTAVTRGDLTRARATTSPSPLTSTGCSP